MKAYILSPDADTLRRIGGLQSVHVQTSVCASDVGFDLRRSGITVVIPERVESVEYDDQAGARAVATGTRKEIVAQLRRAGYRVR